MALPQAQLPKQMAPPPQQRTIMPHSETGFGGGGNTSSGATPPPKQFIEDPGFRAPESSGGKPPPAESGSNVLFFDVDTSKGVDQPMPVSLGEGGYQVDMTTGQGTGPYGSFTSDFNTNILTLDASGQQYLYDEATGMLIPQGGGGGGGEGGGGAPAGESGPALVTVDPNMTVQGQIKDILDPNSPLMKQAETQALQEMNERGLVNSSMAVGAAQDAMIQNALPIAQQDASTMFTAEVQNANTINQFQMAELTHQQSLELAEIQHQYNLETQAEAAAYQQSLAVTQGGIQSSNQSQAQFESFIFQLELMRQEELARIGQDPNLSTEQYENAKNEINKKYDDMISNYTQQYEDGKLFSTIPST